MLCTVFALSLCMLSYVPVGTRTQLREGGKSFGSNKKLTPPALWPSRLRRSFGSLLRTGLRLSFSLRLGCSSLWHRDGLASHLQGDRVLRPRLFHITISCKAHVSRHAKLFFKGHSHRLLVFATQVILLPVAGIAFNSSRRVDVFDVRHHQLQVVGEGITLSNDPQQTSHFWGSLVTYRYL